jgi:GxxExxY protein
VIDSTVVLEVKAVSQIEEIHVSQLVAYLKATGLRAGLLINFNGPVLKKGIRRVIR